ncbi:MAG: hypothetical protein PF483_07280 [Halothiobacillus sp.]|jgi:hypothetical protein|nr:hypothetical protein [Halothiobacillus sp.]
MLESTQNSRSRAGHSAWCPTLKNMPRGLMARINNSMMFGLPVGVISVIVEGFLLYCAQLPQAELAGLPSTFLFFGMFAATFPALQALLVFAMIPVFMLAQIGAVSMWAKHGYYREGMPPRGYDLSSLTMMSNQYLLECALR